MAFSCLLFPQKTPPSMFFHLPRNGHIYIVEKKLWQMPNNKTSPKGRFVQKPES